MQNECSKGNDNYYFLCRKKASEHNDALSSRLGAASRLNISESALRNYEVDTANVPQDIVCPKWKPTTAKTTAPSESTSAAP